MISYIVFKLHEDCQRQPLIRDYFLKLSMTLFEGPCKVKLGTLENIHRDEYHICADAALQYSYPIAS